MLVVRVSSWALRAWIWRWIAGGVDVGVGLGATPLIRQASDKSRTMCSKGIVRRRAGDDCRYSALHVNLRLGQPVADFCLFAWREAIAENVR